MVQQWKKCSEFRILLCVVVVVVVVVVCVCVCACVFVYIHREGVIYLKQFKYQGTDQQCCIEEVSFLRQVPSSLLRMKYRAFQN